MRTQLFKLSCAATFLLATSLSFAQTAAPLSAPLTDEQVLKELATMPVRKGQAAPTLADFRSMESYSADSKGMRPATMAEFRWVYKLKHIPYELAQTYYPAVLKSTTHAEYLTLSFVIDHKYTVLAHTSSTAKPVIAESINSTIAQLFPNQPIALAVNNGAECFVAASGEHARFCVQFAMLR